MIKVAVCSEENIIRKKLEKYTMGYLSKIGRQASTVEFISGIKLLESKLWFDIIFLDMEMHEISGLETAAKLRKWDVHSKIIFMSIDNQYKDWTYKVHAFDYLCKPVTEKVIHNVLEEAVLYLANYKEKEKFSFDIENGIINLELVDIYSFDCLSKRVIINSSQGIFTSMYTLKDLYIKFNKYDFEMPHKSFLLNLLHIRRIKGFEILMGNGEKIPLAQKRAVDFKRIFNDYLQSTFDRV